MIKLFQIMIVLNFFLIGAMEDNKLLDWQKPEKDIRLISLEIYKNENTMHAIRNISRPFNKIIVELPYKIAIFNEVNQIKLLNAFREIRMDLRMQKYLVDSLLPFFSAKNAIELIIKTKQLKLNFYLKLLAKKRYDLASIIEKDFLSWHKEFI